MLHALIDRLAPGRRAARPRDALCPPPVYASRRWLELADWLTERGLGRLRTLPRSPMLPSARRLRRLRGAFHEALAPLHSQAVNELQMAVGRARSLHELWYLRAALYDALARELDQSEAERRLSGIDRLFPLPRRALRAAQPGA